MNAEFSGVFNALQKDESATCPQAALARRLALLLLIAGNDHAASSRLARRHARTTYRHVQLRFSGSFHQTSGITNKNPYATHTTFIAFAIHSCRSGLRIDYHRTTHTSAADAGMRGIRNSHGVLATGVAARPKGYSCQRGSGNRWISPVLRNVRLFQYGVA